MITDERIQALQALCDKANWACMYKDVIKDYCELRTALPECLAEIKELTKWKNEAMQVFAMWDKVYKELGEPGEIGDSIPDTCVKEIKRLRYALQNIINNGDCDECVAYNIAVDTLDDKP